MKQLLCLILILISVNTFCQSDTIPQIAIQDNFMYESEKLCARITKNLKNCLSCCAKNMSGVYINKTSKTVICYVKNEKCKRSAAQLSYNLSTYSNFNPAYCENHCVNEHGE